MKSISIIRSAILAGAVLGPILLAGCEQPRSRYGNAEVHPEQIKFKDTVATNAKVPDKVGELTFVDTAGKKIRIGDFQGNKNVLLVITRGFTQPLCPFCRAQTSRLVSNYPKFQDSSTEVLLVYPGQKGQLEQFLTSVDTVDKGQIDKVPFRILLDDGLEAVQFFGIQANRAYPSTYLFDKQGQIRFAYVGSNDADRPSIQAMLEQIKLLGP
ncbi:MAG: redoxin domain-containing protein [Planctomycetes bacterium]|nr:redoxin domain-containing protein [Planctomycetota bacterium]